MKYLLLFFSFILAQVALTQQIEENQPCGTVVPSQQWDQWFNEKVENYRQTRNLDETYVIPVVVHVIHGGQQVGSVPNISYESVTSQIDVLNEDYAGAGYGTENIPSVFESLLANTGVSFCLALKDPNGNVLAEPGVDRVNYNDVNIANPTSSYNVSSFMNYLDQELKPATIWDPEKYFNIWVSDVSQQVGMLGLAKFPVGSGLSGLDLNDPNPTSDVNDGVWLWYKAFGTVGNYLLQGQSKGRVAVHEAGHWLGLRHIWGDQNCGNDYCTDTPPARDKNMGCSTHPHNQGQCSGNNTGEMFMNFMDYSDSDCMSMFTLDQKERIQTTMKYGDRRKTLGTHVLCNNGPQLPSASFSFENNICAGASVSFNDLSTDSIISWDWSFEGGTPSSSSQTNPVVSFNSPGAFRIELVVSNPNGEDSFVDTIYVGGATAPSVSGDSICAPGLVNLSATSSEDVTLYWYDNENATIAINEGNTYEVQLDNTTTYYVEAMPSVSTYEVGAVDQNIGSGGYFNYSDERGLLFDVSTPCTIRSFTMEANGAGQRTIQVLDGIGGSVVHTMDVNMVAGEQEVVVDFDMSVGTDYFIKITGNNVDCFRNSNGSNYPYTVNDVIEITGNDIMASYPEYYYFFYNWQVEVGSDCPSERIPVIGVINDGISLGSVVNNVQCKEDSNGYVEIIPQSGNAPYDFAWTPNVSTANAATGLSAGDYTVVVSDANGCESEIVVSVEEPEELLVEVETMASSGVGCNGSAWANVTGGTPSYEIIWEIDGETYYGDSISGICVGDYMVQVIDANDCGNEKEFSIDLSTNTQELNSQDLILTLEAGQLYVNNSLNSFSPVNIRMFNSDGRLVINSNLPSGSATVSIDVNHLASGVYFVQVLNETGEMQVKRVLIK